MFNKQQSTKIHTIHNSVWSNYHYKRAGLTFTDSVVFFTAVLPLKHYYVIILLVCEILL